MNLYSVTVASTCCWHAGSTPRWLWCSGPVCTQFSTHIISSSLLSLPPSTCINTPMHACTHPCMHVHTHTHTHAHTHTHTHINTSSGSTNPCRCLSQLIKRGHTVVGPTIRSCHVFLLSHTGLPAGVHSQWRRGYTAYLQCYYIHSARLTAPHHLYICSGCRSRLIWCGTKDFCHAYHVIPTYVWLWLSIHACVCMSWWEMNMYVCMWVLCMHGCNSGSDCVLALSYLLHLQHQWWRPSTSMQPTWQ